MMLFGGVDVFMVEMHWMLREDGFQISRGNLGAIYPSLGDRKYPTKYSIVSSIEQNTGGACQIR